MHKFLAHRTVQDPLLMSDRPGAQAAMLVLLEQMAPKVAALQRRLRLTTERHFVLNASAAICLSYGCGHAAVLPVPI